jgi:hypothetical protein
MREKDIIERNESLKKERERLDRQIGTKKTDEEELLRIMENAQVTLEKLLATKRQMEDLVKSQNHQRHESERGINEERRRNYDLEIKVASLESTIKYNPLSPRGLIVG